MPRKNTLKIAQRQALNIHLSIALMERPLKIWEQVDDLLQTLTGVPKFTEDQDFREHATATANKSCFKSTQTAQRRIDTTHSVQADRACPRYNTGSH